MFAENIKDRIMKKYSSKAKIIIAFLILLLLSIIMDVSKGEIRNGVIDRDVIGGEEKRIELELDAEKLLKEASCEDDANVVAIQLLYAKP